jgi:hypothetical protein
MGKGACVKEGEMTVLGDETGDRGTTAAFDGHSANAGVSQQTLLAPVVRRGKTMLVPNVVGARRPPGDKWPGSQDEAR